MDWGPSDCLCVLSLVTERHLSGQGILREPTLCIWDAHVKCIKPGKIKETVDALESGWLRCGWDVRGTLLFVPPSPGLCYDV